MPGTINESELTGGFDFVRPSEFRIKRDIEEKLKRIGDAQGEYVFSLMDQTWDSDKIQYLIFTVYNASDSIAELFNLLDLGYLYCISSIYKDASGVALVSFTFLCSDKIIDRSSIQTKNNVRRNYIDSQKQQIHWTGVWTGKGKYHGRVIEQIIDIKAQANGTHIAYTTSGNGIRLLGRVGRTDYMIIKMGLEKIK